MSRDREVSRFDLHVVDRHMRQITLNAMPIGAVIERNIDAGLCTCVQYSGTSRILTDDTNEIVFFNAVRYFRPCPAIVFCLVYVDAKVVDLKSGRCEVRRAFIVRRGVYATD